MHCDTAATLQESKNEIAYSRDGLGTNITVATSPMCVRSRGDIDRAPDCSDRSAWAPDHHFLYGEMGG
jgi:hypothetical protein